MNQLFKLAASLLLAVAYLPRFMEPAESTFESKSSFCADEVETGNSPSAPANGESSDDDDDEDEDEVSKKKTPYDWPAIALRIRRILPLVFPRQSRLIYVLISEPKSTSSLSIPAADGEASRLRCAATAHECGNTAATPPIRSDSERSGGWQTAMAQVSNDGLAFSLL